MNCLACGLLFHKRIELFIILHLGLGFPWVVQAHGMQDVRLCFIGEKEGEISFYMPAYKVSTLQMMYLSFYFVALIYSITGRNLKMIG